MPNVNAKKMRYDYDDEVLYSSEDENLLADCISTVARNIYTNIMKRIDRRTRRYKRGHIKGRYIPRRRRVQCRIGGSACVPSTSNVDASPIRDSENGKSVDEKEFILCLLGSVGSKFEIKCIAGKRNYVLARMQDLTPMYPECITFAPTKTAPVREITLLDKFIKSKLKRVVASNRLRTFTCKNDNNSEYYREVVLPKIKEYLRSKGLLHPWKQPETMTNAVPSSSGEYDTN